MINTKTGEILLGNGASVSPKISLSDLSQSKKLEMNLILENDIYKQYSIGRVQIAKTDFFVSLSFENDFLKRISFCLADEHASSWGDWSQEKENKTKILHDKFLQEQLKCKTPYKFSWGRIESSLDIKTGDAEINVTYI